MNPLLNPKRLSRLTTNWIQPLSFLRFLGFLVVFNLAYNSTFAQASTSFENATTSNMKYIDTGSPAMMHVLVNNAGQSMPNATGAGSELGYTATFTPTRTNTSGAAGLTDGDWLGAYDRTATGGQTGDVSINLSAGNDPPPDGDNVYIFEDPDGTVTLEFDPVLLNSPGIMFSMWYIINSSSYENSDGVNDFVRITLDFQSATPDIDLLNTIGSDINDLGLDTENWVQLTQDLSAYMGETVKLVVQVDFNSGSEEMHIDHINFTGGNIVIPCTDAAPPMITCPGNQTRQVDANCNYVLEDLTGLTSTTDDCGPVTVSQNPVVGFTAGTTGAIPMTMTATDGVGNTAQCNFLVLMNDNIAPSITCPGTQTETGDANCEGTLSDYTGLATVSDNCDASPTVTQSPTSGNSFTGNTTVTLTATDASSNSTTCTFTVMVSDNTMPSITCPGNQTRQVDANCNYVLEDLTGLVTTSDNCDASPMVSQNPVVGFTAGTTGAIPMTMTATDAAGNSAQCNFLVLMNDNIAPSITCPVTQTETGDANCEGTLADYTGLATTSDNCDASPAVTQSPTSGNSFTGNTTVTLTSTDASSNSTTCTFTVMVSDNTMPSITCPGNQTRQVDANCNYVLEDLTGLVTTSDNCDASPMVSQNPVVGFTAGTTGAIPMTMTATDAAGNSAQCNFLVLMNDNIAPSITCPVTQTETGDANCEGTLADYTGLATTSDNCDASPTVTQSPTSGNSFTGSTTVTLTSTDASSNSTTCTFTVMVSDNTPPSITTPAMNQTVECDGAGNNADLSAWLASNGGAAATDCSSVTWTNDYVELEPNCGGEILIDFEGFNCQEILTTQYAAQGIIFGPTPLILIDSDNCSYNSGSYPPSSGTAVLFNLNFAEITMTPTSGTWTGLKLNYTSVSTLYLEAYDAGNNLIDIATGPANSGTTGVLEVSAPNIAYVITHDSGNFYIIDDVVIMGGSGSNAITGSSAVTFTATDASGNSTSTTATFTIEDTTPPSLSACPGTQTLVGDANCEATLPDYTGQVTATDACSDATITQSPVAGTTINATTTVMLIATDACGNSTSCSFTVELDDTTAPSISCPGNQTVAARANCEGNLPFYRNLVTAMDNCDSNPSISQSPPEGTYFSDNTMVTLTATDDSGNSNACSFTVTAIDMTEPNAICIAGGETADQENDLTFVGSGTSLGGSNNFMPALSFTVGVTGSLTRIESELTPGTPLGGTVILTLIDGNNPNPPQTVLATETITAVSSSLNFVFTTPVPVTAGQELTMIFGGTTNGGFVATSGLQDSYPGNDRWFSLNGGASYSGPFSGDFDFTTYVDPGGASPMVFLDASGTGVVTPAMIDGGSFDNCTAPNNLDLSVMPNSFACSDLGNQSVTLVVTDEAGLSSSCMTTVQVKDNLAPTAVCTDVTVDIQPDEMASVMASQIAGGSFDNCSAVSLNIQSGTTSYTCDDNGMTFPVTVVISDASGNSTSCTRNVTVADPNSYCCQPADAVCMNTTVQLDANGNASITAADVDGGSTTECGFQSMTVSPNAFTCADVGSGNIVTLTVTDVNGDSDACTAMVTVEDNVAPDAQCKPITVQLNAAGTASITAADIDNGTSDACGIASMNVNGFSSVTVVCVNVGQPNMVQLNVTDVNGNTSSCLSAVTVEDNVAPDAQCKPITVQLNAAGTASITAADIDNGTSDACGIASMNVNGFSSVTVVCVNVGQPNMVQLNVTDANGNTNSCLSAVTVEDNVAPDAQCQNTTVMLDANGNGSITAADVDGGSSDACGIASLAVSPSTFTCSDIGGNTVVLTVTDVNGNTAQCGATVTVEDNLPPNPVCLNPTVYLQPDGTYTLLDTDVFDFVNSTDNCGPLTVTNISPAVVDCDDFDLTIPVSVTVSDGSGNTAVCSALVNVQKGTALPAGWGNDDIGGATGAAEYDPCEELFCVQSNGISFPTSDKIHMAYQYLCAGPSMEVIARVVSVTPPHGFGGIMIRETLDGGSKKVALKTQLNGSYFVQRDSRATTNGFAQTQQIFRPGVTWLRIVRNGNQFLMYTSNNGSFWQFAAFAMVNMNSCVYIGLFAEGINNVSTTTACFDNVSIIGSGGIDLVDGNSQWETESTREIDFNVFPNPATNEANIDLSQFEDKPFTMTVFNNIGQMVYRKEYDYVEAYTEQLDLSNYKNGIYLINIELEDGTLLSKKLVVTNK